MTCGNWPKRNYGELVSVFLHLPEPIKSRHGTGEATPRHFSSIALAITAAIFELKDVWSNSIVQTRWKSGEERGNRYSPTVRSGTKVVTTDL